MYHVPCTMYNFHLAMYNFLVQPDLQSGLPLPLVQSNVIFHSSLFTLHSLSTSPVCRYFLHFAIYFSASSLSFESGNSFRKP